VIKFPKMHIAESALNRLFNAMEDSSSFGVASPMEAPNVPDPTALGVAIEEQVEAPIEPAEVAPEMQEDANAGMVESSMMGGSPFDGALMGAGPL
jgi:hypothetical protein